MVKDEDRFNVKDGDIWIAGRHIIACGDVDRGDAEKLVTKGRVDMAYTDPPWNSRVYAQFHKLAGITDKVLDYPNFLDALIQCLSHVKGDVYIEIGRKEQKSLEAHLDVHGAQIRNIWRIAYQEIHACLLYRVSWIPFKPDSIDFGGLDDKAIPVLAIQHSSVRGNMVFDPCIGEGLTALSANSVGRTVLGLELSAKRVSVCLSRLQRAGHEVSKMGRL